MASARLSGPVGLPGSIAVQQEGTGCVVCLSGEIDAGVVDEFDRAHGRTPVPIDAIDAGAVTFIGLSGVALLLRWSQASAAAGRPAILRRSSPRLDRVLHLTGIEDAFPRAAG